MIKVTMTIAITSTIGHPEIIPIDQIIKIRNHILGVFADPIKG